MINNSNNGHHQNGNGYKSNGFSRMSVETKERDVRDGNEVTDEELKHAMSSKLRSDTPDASDFDETHVLLDDADDAQAELLDEQDAPATHDFKRSDERRGRLRRVLVSLLIVCALLTISASVIYFWLMGDTRQSDMSLRVQTNGATDGRSEESAGALTAEEINRAMNNPQRNADGINIPHQTPSNQPSLSENTLNGGVPLTARPPIDSYSPTYDAPLAEPQAQTATNQNQSAQTQTATERVASNTGTNESVNRQSKANGSGANPERSIRVNFTPAANEDNNSTTNINRTNGGTTVNESTNQVQGNYDPATDTSRVAVPPLGTMLPVRTLGAFYTLRSETLVRMQLTRDVSGRGWSLSRGTEIYGEVRGSDYEVGRAYVQLIGFVDRETNRLVRLQGNLLGSDGTDGLRGRKHTVGGGWSRALRMAGAGALDALSAISGGIGRRPVVIGDVYGYGASRASSPLMAEINGMAYRNNRVGFVEVPANSAGYVFVMQMPREAESVDALANLSPTNLERNSDAASPRVANTQLSDEQVATLMTTSTPEQIRLALPRLSPEMRRVAQSVLASSGR